MHEILQKHLNKPKAEQHFAEMIDDYYWFLTREETEEDDDEYGEGYYPLEERNSGIYEAINLLIQNELDLNEEYKGTVALEYAVAWPDHYMAEYLIKHGADPNIWGDMYADGPLGLLTNWYLDDIDIGLFDELISNEPDEVMIDALVKTAHVLVDIGGLRSYTGLCLKIEEDGSGSISAPKLKY